MLSFSAAFPDPARLQTERLILRRPEMGDFEQWSQLRRESEGFLRPFEPEWAKNELSRQTWRIIMRRQSAEISSGRSLPWFLFRAPEGRHLLGGLTLSYIRRRISQSATLGYWMGEAHAGKGYMSEAVEAVCQEAFSNLGLHRIEAATVLDNAASMSVLERCGFQREGLARSYLQIAGEWRDHHLFARLASD